MLEGYLDTNAEKCSNWGQGTLYVPGQHHIPSHLNSAAKRVKIF